MHAEMRSSKVRSAVVSLQFRSLIHADAILTSSAHPTTARTRNTLTLFEHTGVVTHSFGLMPSERCMPFLRRILPRCTFGLMPSERRMPTMPRARRQHAVRTPSALPHNPCSVRPLLPLLCHSGAHAPSIRPQASWMRQTYTTVLSVESLNCPGDCLRKAQATPIPLGGPVRERLAAIHCLKENRSN
jgi:hypothetical protein